MQTPVIKRQTEAAIYLQRRFYLDSQQLQLNRQECLKCDICQTVCPKEAIAVAIVDEQLVIDIDPDLCVLCGLCAHFCPVACISLQWNAGPFQPLLEQRAVPSFPDKITVETSKCPLPCTPVADEEGHWCRQQRQWVESREETCPKRCYTCLENCPRQAFVLEAEEVRPEKDRCLRCTLCMEKCEAGAIVVRPLFWGAVSIDASKCPEDCNLCIDWCPARCIAREGSRVVVTRETCALCGVCVNICPQGAVRLVRRGVHAEDQEFSEAWDTAVAKLKTAKGEGGGGDEP